MPDRYPQSPCTGVCRIDSAGRLCQGCRRTLEEIARWPYLTAAGRAEVYAKIKIRSAAGADVEPSPGYGNDERGKP